MDRETKKKLIYIGIIFLMLYFIRNILMLGPEKAIIQLIFYTMLTISGVTAVVFHEVSHGYVSHLLGDPLPKATQRLTLNPLKHLDPLGTVMFLVIKIGWAKPVLIDPSYYKNRKLGELLVSAAGPGANFLLAVAACLFYHHLVIPFTGGLQVPMEQGFFTAGYTGLFMWSFFMVNTSLCVFNLLPVPPLDGSKILMAFLPEDMRRAMKGIEAYSMLIFIVFIYTRAFDTVFIPMVSGLQGMIQNLIMLTVQV